MEFLIEWVTNIILFVLLATVIDMLLPSSALQKYTKIVTGLLLIAVILGPFLKFITSDFERAMAAIPALEANGSKENSKNLIETKKKEIQASQHAYILEQMAVQLKADSEEELMEQFGLEIAGITIDAAPGKDGQELLESITNVAVKLKKPDEAHQPVKPVEMIEIQASAPVAKSRTAETDEELRKFLSEKWDVPEETIDVAIEGGMDKGGE